MPAPTSGITKVEEIGHGRRRATWTDQINLATDDPERTYIRAFRVTNANKLRQRRPNITTAL